jgi:hypothetical protein
LVSQLDSHFTNLTKGVHRFRVLDQCGNGVVQQIAIDTLLKPKIFIQGSDLCLGSDIVIFSPEQFTDATYFWTGPNNFTSTDDSITFNPLTYTDLGTYTVTQNIPGCLKSNTTTFELTDCALILPVTLLDFYLVNLSNAVSVRWKTATEHNNAGFEVQKSFNGLNWSTLSFIPTKAVDGNSTQLLTYEYPDYSHSDGKVFYRLAQVELNGHKQYSQVISMEFDAINPISVYPNPTTGVATLSGLEENSIIELRSVHGLLLLSDTTQTGKYQLDMTHYPNGVYLLTILNLNGVVHQSKIIKE